MKKSLKIKKCLTASRAVYKAMEFYISGDDSNGDWSVKSAIGTLQDIEESEGFSHEG